MWEGAEREASAPGRRSWERRHMSQDLVTRNRQGLRDWEFSPLPARPRPCRPWATQGRAQPFAFEGLGPLVRGTWQHRRG